MTQPKTAQQDKHKHHITPEHYLSGFTKNPSSSTLWGLQQGQPPFETGITGLGFIKDFYAYTHPDGTKEFNEVEDYLANEIEGPANKVLKKLRNHQLPTATDKLVLSRYMAAMLTRVPRHRERLVAIYPEKLDQVISDVDDMLTRTAAAYPHRQERVEELRKQLRDEEPRYRAAVPDWLLAKSVSDKYAHVFADMNWVFFTATERHGFVTGDNPVFFPEGIGLKGDEATRQRVEVSFPISKDVALWASWRPVDMAFVPYNQPIVREINHRTAHARTRFLYYHSTPRWVHALNNKPKAAIKLKGTPL